MYHSVEGQLFFPLKNMMFILDQEGFSVLGLYLAAVFVVGFAIRSFESIQKCSQVE